MPQTTSVGVIASIVAIISGIVGLIVGGGLALIGAGRKMERMESGLARSHARLDEHEKTFATHDQALKNMLSVFTSQDGEPRYVTSIICGKNSSACKSGIEEKIGYVDEKISRVESEVALIKTAQDNNLKTILDEIRMIKS